LTFQTPAWLIDGGASLNGQFARMMLAAASSQQQGVIGPLDCIVSQTTPSASAGVLISAGSVIVFGQEVTQQGSYFGENTGVDSSLTIAATGGSIRSDMIVVRAEDPTFSGSPWAGPPSGQILFARVISGVSAGATQPPGGISAIPLARIDIPVSTSIITNAMIHDIRSVALAQQVSSVLSVAGPGSPSNSGSTSTAVQWPTGATWSVFIPSWATVMTAQWTIAEVLWNGTNAVRGFIYPVIGASVTAPTVSFTQMLISDLATEANSRHTYIGGGTVNIPASIRGTTQTVQIAQKTDGTAIGTLAFNEGSFVTLDYTFQGLAATS
jgi:hypothetical protein